MTAAPTSTGGGPRNAWPAAVIVAVAMVCVTVLAVAHAASGDLLTLISAAVVPTVTMLLVGGQISSGVAEVRHQVNGRMSQLIDALARATPAASSSTSSTTGPPA